MREKRIGERRHLHRFAPGVLAVALVLTVSTLTAFGYVTCSSVNSGNLIQAGTYGVSVTVNGEPVEDACTLGQDSYTIALIPTGTVEKGHCTVTVDGTSYDSGTIAQDGYTFTIANYETQSIAVTFDAAWGTHACTIVDNQIVLGEPPVAEMEKPQSTVQPEPQPNSQPDSVPSVQPTVEPEVQPTAQPQPSVEPEIQPNAQPSLEPEPQPQPDLDG